MEPTLRRGLNGHCTRGSKVKDEEEEEGEGD